MVYLKSSKRHKDLLMLFNPWKCASLIYVCGVYHRMIVIIDIVRTVCGFGRKPKTNLKTRLSLPTILEGRLQILTRD